MRAKGIWTDPLNLVITGVGGQGNVLISLVVGKALVDAGYFVTIGETYGASQRGGPVMSHVRVSENTQYSPFIPDGCADIVLGMEPVETLRMLGRYGNPNVVTIVNPRPIYSIDVTGGQATYPDLDELMSAIRHLSAKVWTVNATEEAQKMGNAMFANSILVGALVASNVMPLDGKRVELVLRETFPKEIDANILAFRKGMELAKSG